MKWIPQIYMITLKFYNRIGAESKMKERYFLEI